MDYDKGLGYCMYDAGFYRTVLTQYASDASGKRADINRAYEENNWTDYKTYVHALKSSSKTIGATELSELAKLHEDAAKENNIDLITDKKDELFDLYKEVGIAIAEAIGLDTRDEDDESDSDDILEFAPEGGE